MSGVPAAREPGRAWPRRVHQEACLPTVHRRCPCTAGLMTSRAVRVNPDGLK